MMNEERYWTFSAPTLSNDFSTLLLWEISIYILDFERERGRERERERERERQKERESERERQI
jgi:hypothetical protein